MTDHEANVLVGATTVEPTVPDAEDSAVKVAGLVHLHFDFIWRFLRRLGLRDAEDGAQQVFTIAWKKLDDMENGKERAYLVGIALKVAADARRARARRPEAPEEAPEPAASGADPAELLDQRRARQIVDEMLSTLVPDLREAFVLFEIEELTVREIAETLGIPAGTAASRLRRAREAFQVELGRRFPSTTVEEP
jgi:RNA polymerase sigma-70 factor (ECF subfamily)